MFISCTGGRPCRLVVSVKDIKTLGMNILWILRIKHVWFKHVHCNNLNFDLVHCGGMVFCFQLPSFGSSPKTIACFMHASGYYKLVFLRIYDGFAVPLQLVFLPFLTKFLMKGLVWWVRPYSSMFSVWSLSLSCHRGRCIWLWSLEIA